MRAMLPFIFAVTLAGPASAADSVVIGRGISNSYFTNLPCSANEICLDSLFMWVLDSTRSVAGPTIKGTVRALIAQHVAATRKFVESAELFVLQPIQDDALRKRSGADYYLLSVSPRNENGRYCLSKNPDDVGLKLPKAQVSMDIEGSRYCFDAALLR